MTNSFSVTIVVSIVRNISRGVDEGIKKRELSK